MSSVIGILAIGLMLIVLLIATASLVVLAIIPIARFLENRQDKPPNG